MKQNNINIIKYISYIYVEKNKNYYNSCNSRVSSKMQKIEEYLGPGYKCVATYGHLRTLASLKDIDIENNYRPTYSIIDESLKKKQVEVLR